MYQGCDVSAAQTLTQDNFAQMSKTMSFCIVECYVGNDYLSSTYNPYKSYTVNAGMKFLPYNFAYPLPTDPNHPNRSPIDQCNLHYSYSGSPAVLDLEFPNSTDYAKWNITSPQFIVDWVNAYCEQWKTLSGGYPILYTYPYFMQQLSPADISSFANYKLWIASYAPTPIIPKPWTDYVLWQYSNTGHLPNGQPVDLDCCEDLSIFD